MKVEFAAETWVLSAERALIWPRRRTLLVADTHFGKAAVFRRAGIPIPEGIDAHDLARLGGLIDAHGVERLIVLGDFFHGNPDAGDGFAGLFAAWLARHAALQIDVVAGNHDRHGGAGSWPARLRWHAPVLRDGSLCFAHAPADGGLAAGFGVTVGARDAAAVEGFSVCGHLHPVVRLAAVSGDRARAPAFWISSKGAVLPAFGAFTGGAVLRPGAGDRVFAIAGGEVLALPVVRAVGDQQRLVGLKRRLRARQQRQAKQVREEPSG